MLSWSQILARPLPGPRSLDGLCVHRPWHHSIAGCGHGAPWHKGPSESYRNLMADMNNAAQPRFLVSQLHRRKSGYARMIELDRMLGIIARASPGEFERDETLQGRLVVSAVKDLSVCYAPFDHVQAGARLVLVGITPGRQQARNALVEAHRKLAGGADYQTALSAAKVFASFSGPMRTNLVAMLDHIGLNRWLGIPTTADVWGERSDLVHFTSALRYPVYNAGKNYRGSPSMTVTPVLRDLLEKCLGEEAKVLPDAVWVPLGPSATEGVAWLVQMGVLRQQQVLEGLPHPSGANAERITYFLGRKDRALLSAKTSAERIDNARTRLVAQIDGILRN